LLFQRWWGTSRHCLTHHFVRVLLDQLVTASGLTGPDGTPMRFSPSGPARNPPSRHHLQTSQGQALTRVDEVGVRDGAPVLVPDLSPAAVDSLSCGDLI